MRLTNRTLARRLAQIVGAAPTAKAANVCPVCGQEKKDVRDRMLTRNYVPGQSEDSHLLSCRRCFEELEGA